MFWRRRLLYLALLILLLRQVNIFYQWIFYYSEMNPPVSSQIIKNNGKDPTVLSDGDATQASFDEASTTRERSFIGYFTYEVNSEMSKENNPVTNSQQLFSQTMFYVSSECAKQIRDPLEPPDCARISPLFIIAGAQKAGTTSLYMYLSKHPQLLALSKDSKAMGGKEVRFFDKLKNYTADIDVYMKNFPAVHELSELQDLKTSRAVVGESTPNYIRHPECPQRVADLLPDIKIIMLLRNPVDRAYSHYQHALRIDGQKKVYTGGNDFESFVKAEEDMLGTCDYLRFDWPAFSKCYGQESAKWARKLKIPKRKNGRLTWMFQSMMRGMYAGQLINFAERFSAKQILAIQSEEFYIDTATVMKRVEKFLGLHAFDWDKALNEMQIFNFGFNNNVYESSKSKDYEPLPEELRKKMTDIFQKYNMELYELFKDPFPRWN